MQEQYTMVGNPGDLITENAAPETTALPSSANPENFESLKRELQALLRSSIGQEALGEKPMMVEVTVNGTKECLHVNYTQVIPPANPASTARDSYKIQQEGDQDFISLSKSRPPILNRTVRDLIALVSGTDAESDFKEKLTELFTCPINYAVFTAPLLLNSGVTIDQDAYDLLPSKACPITQEPITFSLKNNLVSEAMAIATPYYPELAPKTMAEPGATAAPRNGSMPAENENWENFNGSFCLIVLFLDMWSLLSWSIEYDNSPTRLALYEQYKTTCASDRMRACDDWTWALKTYGPSDQTIKCREICHQIASFKERMDRDAGPRHSELLMVLFFLHLCLALNLILYTHRNKISEGYVSARNALRLTFFPPDAAEIRVPLLEAENYPLLDGIEMAG